MTSDQSGCTVNEDNEDLHRFIEAQEPVFQNVIRELQAGAKRSHWMWFIFPQIAGLGHSRTARFYAIKTISEAKEYMAHPVLGMRFIACTQILITHDGISAIDIFGDTDAMKLQSSMTLFAHVTEPNSVFQQTLDKYFDGELDRRTLDLIDK